MTGPEGSQAQERRFDAEKDTELSAPLTRMLGHLGYVDALETVEPDMVNPDHVDERWVELQDFVENPPKYSGWVDLE